MQVCSRLGRSSCEELQDLNSYLELEGALDEDIPIKDLKLGMRPRGSSFLQPLTFVVPLKVSARP